MTICRTEKLYDERPITNFSIYISDYKEIGKVLDAMSYIGDGECTIKIVNDEYGNTVYCITGWADKKSDISELEAACLRTGIQAQFGE